MKEIKFIALCIHLSRMSGGTLTNQTVPRVTEGNVIVFEGFKVKNYLDSSQCFKGHSTQYSGHTGKIIQTEKR